MTETSFQSKAKIQRLPDIVYRLVPGWCLAEVSWDYHRPGHVGREKQNCEATRKIRPKKRD